MSQLLIAMLGLFGFGVIAAEIINNFEFMAYRLNAYWVAGLVSLGYGGSQLFLKKLKSEAGHSVEATNRYDRSLKVYHVVLIVMGVVVALSIPFIWWGVIKKLASAANDGSKLFQ